MTTPIPSYGTPGITPDVAPIESLDSEALLTFGADMTARFDAQILASMNEMQAGLATTDELALARAYLQQLATELSAEDSDEHEMHELSSDQLERLEELGLLDELGIDPATPDAPLSVLQQAGASILGPASRQGAETPSVSISTAMIDRAEAQLELRQTQVNSAQEQRLLVLQETMRQRSQLTQLLSNILRERGETMSHVVRNIA